MPKPTKRGKRYYSAGKGDWRRDRAVSEQEFSDNWDLAFGTEAGKRVLDARREAKQVAFDKLAKGVQQAFSAYCGSGLTPSEEKISRGLAAGEDAFMTWWEGGAHPTKDEPIMEPAKNVTLGWGRRELARAAFLAGRSSR